MQSFLWSKCQRTFDKWCRARTKDDINGETLIQISVGEGVAGRVALNGEAMNIPDAYANPFFQRDVDRLTAFTTNTLLACPIADFSGNHVAVIEVKFLC